MPRFSRAATTAAQDLAPRGGGGKFKPFLHEISWRSDKEERNLLFLSPIDESENGTPSIYVHNFIKIGTGKRANGDIYDKFGTFMCRTNTGLEEASCHLCQLDNDPKLQWAGIAVELEPVVELEGSRKKIVGFEVATKTFSRKVKGEDGEEELEEVVAPLIGLVSQSPSNFWKTLKNWNDTRGDITEVPFQVIRDGMKTETSYDFFDYRDVADVDLTPLLDNLGGISYLEDKLEDVESKVGDIEDDHEAALYVAGILLNQWLDEISDTERYKELALPITDIPKRFGQDTKKKSAPRNGGGRSSRRRESTDGGSESQPSETKAERFRRLREEMNAG